MKQSQVSVSLAYTNGRSVSWGAKTKFFHWNSIAVIKDNHNNLHKKYWLAVSRNWSHFSYNQVTTIFTFNENEMHEKKH